jgi:hypothetical protein
MAFRWQAMIIERTMLNLLVLHHKIYFLKKWKGILSNTLQCIAKFDTFENLILRFLTVERLFYNLRKITICFNHVLIKFHHIWSKKTPLKTTSKTNLTSKTTQKLPTAQGRMRARLMAAPGLHVFFLEGWFEFDRMGLARGSHDSWKTFRSPILIHFDVFIKLFNKYILN